MYKRQEQKQQENEQTAETKVEIPPENEEEQKGGIGVILNGDETEAYTLAPVSYTHRDVYKRQKLQRPDSKGSCIPVYLHDGCR